MGEGDRIKVTSHINGEDAPSLGEWLPGGNSRTVREENIMVVGEKMSAMLRKAAEHFGLIMEVGSQRPMIDFLQLVETYSAAREAAPHAFLIANIGAAQLIAQKGSPGYTLEQIEKLVEAIEADALAIPLEFLAGGGSARRRCPGQRLWGGNRKGC